MIRAWFRKRRRLAAERCDLGVHEVSARYVLGSTARCLRCGELLTMGKIT